MLELISDIEEKLKGEYLFDQQFVKSSAEALQLGVATIVERLNSMSGNKYRNLDTRLNAIRTDIDNILSPKRNIPVTDLVISLDSLDEQMTGIAGRKIARLGDMKKALNLPVPDGFSITAYAFQRFLEYNHLTEKIHTALTEMTSGTMEETNRICRNLREAVIQAEIPSELHDAVAAATAALKPTADSEQLMVSVRSSAVQEDGEISFAGQYATFLNVPEHLVLQKYKDVVASVFRPRAVYYFKTKGFSEADLVMTVGIIRMINARSGGVMYTRDPNAPESDRLIINAAWGLGKSVVDGLVTPHTFVVSRVSGEILENIASNQAIMLVCAENGDIEEASVPGDGVCLNGDQIRTLAVHGHTLEQYYGKPQDVEWAVDREGRICILQSRALKTVGSESAHCSIPRRLEQYPILIDTGRIASRGVGHGRAFLWNEHPDVKAFPPNGVLIAGNMSADFVLMLDRAAAMVIDTGGITGHMASLAREYGIPTIVGAGTATRIIKQDQEITVDAVNGNVYAGKVPEILKYADQRSSFRDTRVFRMLEAVFDHAAPLNLISPDAETFSPAYCKTYHDITRFSHEKAMAEMFSIGEDHDMDECRAVPLKAGIPMDAHLIDLGGGLAENIIRATPADIRSLPFSAFLRGMMSMRWPEPRPADVKGFLGMVANTAAIPEGDLRDTASRSYAVLSDNYMNFSIRLGYHFSAVEAYSGENINCNYIKFHFKGGGATTDRRLRRIRLIAEVLKKMEFTLVIKGDVMDATLPKYSRAITEKRLEIMGKLTAYTKQLDMALYNDAVMDLFIDDFIRDHSSDA